MSPVKLWENQKRIMSEFYRKCEDPCDHNVCTAITNSDAIFEVSERFLCYKRMVHIHSKMMDPALPPSRDDIREQLTIMRHAAEVHGCAFSDTLWDRQTPPPEDMATLAQSTHPRDVHFIGWCCHSGRLGAVIDYREAYRRFCMAADAGLASAIRFKGECLEYGRGVAKDTHAARVTFTEAIKAGSPKSWYELSHSLARAGKHHQADVALLRGSLAGSSWCEGIAGSLFYALPLGEWMPDAIVHSLQPARIHRAQQTMLLITRRLGMAKGVDMAILRYISANGDSA